MNPEVIPVAENLELRPIVPEHAEELYALVEANRPRLREWMTWLSDKYSLEDMRQYALERHRDNVDGKSLTLTIWLEGKLCGALGLHQIDARNRSSSIGYWLAESVQGRGVMSRACKSLLRVAFSEYGLNRIEIRCATGNARSKAIPRRLGFTEEGLLRQAEWLHDHWVDLRVFAMLKSEWQPENI